MKIHVLQKQTDLKINRLSVKKLVVDFLKFHAISADEVSIFFVNTAEICDLHEEYFNDPSPTDCISFPMDETGEFGYRHLGDIFVCPETAVLYAQKHAGDSYHEMTLYVVHGLLHLLGYDDLKAKDRKVMRTEEARYLTQVAEKNLWIKS